MVEDLRLRSSRRLLLDTNALIYFLTGLEPYYEVVESVLRRVQRGEAQVVVSVVTEAELLVRPERDGDVEAKERISDLLSEDGITVLGMNRVIARRAAAIRARSGAIRLPDAIIIATALEADCDVILGNDGDWSKLSELPYVRLDDIT